MIFNRTISDVSNAKEIIKNKIQLFLAVTNDEIEILEKGTLTINTLNRIEEKQKELSESLKKIGYFGNQIITKSWSIEDKFYLDDLRRIISNNEILRDSFYVYYDTPESPSAEYYYTNINDIEKILYDIEQTISDVISLYKFCGSYYCGG